MSIRCKDCEDREPEWDSRDECCLICWEQHERTSIAWKDESENVAEKEGAISHDAT